VKRGSFLWIERAEQPVLDGRQAALGPVELGDPRVGDRDDVAAPVLGIASPHDELAPLEVVEQPDEVAGVKPERLRATVLVAPHHGFNCSNEFAAIVKPEIVVASCLSFYKDSVILSPAHKITEQFAGTGAKVFTTAWHGRVTIVSDGEKCEVTTTKTLDHLPPNPDKEKAAAAAAKP
jgi:hypothetical protein